MKSRLYITDLDKTLLRSDLSISHYTKAVWNVLAQSDVRLTIATARSAPKSRELLKDLILHHPLIVMDGALIVSPEGDILMSNALHKEEAEAVLTCGRKYGINPFMIGIDHDNQERFAYSAKLNALQAELIAQYKNDQRLRAYAKVQPLRDNIKIVYIDKKEPLEALQADLHATFGNNSIEIKFFKDHYIDGYFLTVLHPKGDKSHALAELQKMLSIKNEKLTVFGDSHNDIGMFHLAQEKIAMQNAVEEVKKIATHILPHTNDEDGVAKYLEKLQI